MKSFKKFSYFKLFLFGLTGLCLTLFLTIFIYLEITKPPMHGTVHFEGLEKPVQIVRDQWGVPHIKGKSRRDVTRALGYLMASERWFQMEIHRRVARGELAELFGEKALKVDKLYRTFDFVGHFKNVQKVHPMPEELRREMSWYYEGINQYIATHSRPIEFWLAGIPVRPFSMDDAYAFIGYMSYSFGIGLRQDSFMTLMKTKLEREFFEGMRSEPENIFQKVSQLENAHQFLIKAFSPMEGSNGWLISGKHSKSGRAILANDPHITFSKPNLWMEAHLLIEDESQSVVKNEYGYFLPLIALPVLYHSPDKAWGLTMSLTDDMDLYKLRTNSSGNAYLLDDKEVAFEKKEEIIPVKGKPAVVLQIKKSVFGPVLEHVLEQKEEKFRDVALHWSVFKIHNDPLTSLFKMRESKNMAEFKSAVATGVAPGLNILYADKENNIGWWLFGEVEVKPQGTKTDEILVGEKTTDLPSKTIAFEELPHAENPKEGYIVSANSRPANYPTRIRGEFQPSERYDTILTLLKQKEVWSVEELEELQSLNVNINSQSRLAFLMSFLSSKELAFLDSKLLQELKNWDGISDMEDRVPTLYYTWLKHISMNSLVGFSDDEKNVYSQFPAEWFRLSRLLKNLSLENARDKELVINAFNMTLEELNKLLGPDEMKWRWGKLHTLELVHPLGMVFPLNYIFNEGPHPVSGAFNEINNMKWGQFNEGFLVKAGPSVRRIIDFGSINNTRSVLPLGISGHGSSPFRKNQLSLFLKGQYREMVMDKAIFTAPLEYKMELLP